MWNLYDFRIYCFVCDLQRVGEDMRMEIRMEIWMKIRMKIRIKIRMKIRMKITMKITMKIRMKIRMIIRKEYGWRRKNTANYDEEGRGENLLL